MTQQEVIKTFMQSLNDTTLKGAAALDEAIKASSKFKNFKAVKTQFLKDIKAAKSWHRFLVEKCGIILDNADTGAISGSDAGGAKAKTATDILPSTGEAKYPKGSSFTVDGLTIYGIPSEKRLTEDQRYVIKGLYSWWIRDSLALIKESYGFSFTDVDTTNSRLKMKFVNDEDDSSLAYVSYDSDDDKTYESRVLCVNMAYFENMSESNRHGSTDSAALDRVLVHELVHGLMASNIKYFADLPDFLTEGGSAELIHGLDDENYDELIEYAKAPKVFEKILTTKLFEDPPYEIYGGGYIFMRYFAKQAGTDTTFDYDKYRKTISIGSKGGFATNYYDKVTMKGGKGSDTITNSGSNVLITAGAGKDTVKTYSDKVTVNAGDGADFILNDGKNVSIGGGKGNDSVENNGDKVSIKGDAGADSVVNVGSNVSISGGNDNDFITNKISDYETVEAFTEEELEEGIGSSNGVTVTTWDGDVYVGDVVGGNNSTLSGGKGEDSLTNYAGKVFIYGDEDNDTIANYGFSAIVYGGEGDDSIFNASYELDFDGDTVAVSGYKSELDGGNGDDYFENAVDKVKIYGEDGEDSVYNSGEDVSVYGGAGVDYVENYGDWSYISLGDGDDFVDNSAESVEIKGDAGKDELVNFGDESTLSGGANDDDIWNYGDYSSLAGDKGNDYIYSCGKQVSVVGGDGNDTLYNEGVKAYLLGGKGKDTLFNEGDHVTLSGGAGNDEIYNDGKHIVYQFGTGDGKDTVFGFNDDDTLQITKGKYSTQKSGDDVVVKIGSNMLTIKDAADKTINFTNAAGKKASKNYSAKVAPLWFADDNNFTTTDNLSSLVKNKSAAVFASDNLNYSSDLTRLTKKGHLITYSRKVSD